MNYELSSAISTMAAALEELLEHPRRPGTRSTGRRSRRAASLKNRIQDSGKNHKNTP